MQVLVIYYSRSGNTKKLAEAVARGVKEIKGVGCLVKPAKEVTGEDLLNSGGIVAGSPVYYGTLAAELKEVFEKNVGLRDRMENKVGAAFATSGGDSGGKETTLISIIQAMLINGMIVVGDPLAAGGHYGVACVGSPGEAALKNAARLGRRVAELAERLGQAGTSRR